MIILCISAFLFVYMLMIVTKISIMLQNRYDTDMFSSFNFIDTNGNVCFMYLRFGFNLYYDKKNQCVKKVRGLIL